MKKIFFQLLSFIILLAITLSVHPLQAQTKIVLDEEFNEDNGSWITKDDDEVSLQIHDGFYYFEHKEEKGSWMAWRNLPVGNGDFSLISRTIHVNGTNNSGYGLVFGLSDANNTYVFNITANGYYRVGKWDDGTWSIIVDWTESSVINQGDQEENNLEVIRRGSNFEFYVNDTKVTTTSAYPFFGEKFGFVVFADQRIAFDYAVARIYDQVQTTASKQEETKSVMQAETPQLALDPLGHSSQIMDMQFTKDGKSLISVSKDKTIRIWDVETGENIKTYRAQIGDGDEGMNYTMSISPDSKILAVGGFYDKNGGSRVGNIRYFDLQTGKMLRVFKGHKDVVSAVRFSPDGSRFASGGMDKYLTLWKKDDLNDFLYNNKKYKVNSFVLDNGIANIAFSPDGNKVVASQYYQKNPFLIDITTISDQGQPTSMKSLDDHHQNECYAVAFSPDGKHILSVESYKAYLWSSNGEFESEFGTDIHLAADGKVIFSNSGNEVLIGGDVYQFPSGTKLSSWTKSSSIKAAAFWGNSMIATAGTQYKSDSKDALSPLTQNDIYIWNAATGEEIKHLYSKGRQFKGFAFTKNGLQLALSDKITGLASEATSIEAKDVLRVFDFENLKLVNSYNGKEPVSNNLKFEHNGKILKRPGMQSDGTESLGELDYGTAKINENGSAGMMSCFSVAPDGLVLFGTNTGMLGKYDPDGTNSIEYVGHNASIEAIAISTDGKYFVSLGEDNTFRLWDLNDKGTKEGNKNIVRPIVTLFITLDDEWICYTNDRDYASSKKGAKNVGFHVNQGKDFEAKFYPFEQFDVRYNRPDLVLKKLGVNNPELQNAYLHAYQKRLAKMGFKEADMSDELQLPEVTIKTLSGKTESKTDTIEFSASDSKYKLDRINIYVNDVPLFGSKGMSIKADATQSVSKQLPIELTNGKNKIQISVMNEKGTESSKETITLFYNGQETKHNLYVIAIGVSKYTDKQYNLTYASKDANDVATLLAGKKASFNAIHVIKILDEKATKENILKAKDSLQLSKTDDEVIVFFAGHGLVDDSLDYYLATTDVDFNKPAEKGLPYDVIESLVDGIPARKKLILMDACNSGEVDKDESKTIADNSAAVKGVKSRGFKKVVSKTNELGLKNSFELMQELFSDLRRGSGAMIISSASGKEFSYESSQWKNGIFTFCLLDGLKSNKADGNKDGAIRISELRDYVIENVQKLTNGKQTPTSRRENLEFDFKVY